MKNSYLGVLLLFGACGGVEATDPVPGPAGPQGDMGIPGGKGDKGDPGEPGPFPTGDLPSGVTLRGAFRAGGNGAAAAIAQNGISFTYTLSADPIPHFIATGTTAPAECPGSLADPEAMPGHLCLYEAFHSASVGTSQAIVSPVTNASGQASRFGFGFSIQTNATGNFASNGTWAVTAL